MGLFIWYIVIQMAMSIYILLYVNRQSVGLIRNWLELIVASRVRVAYRPDLFLLLNMRLIRVVNDFIMNDVIEISMGSFCIIHLVSQLINRLYMVTKLQPQ